MWQAFKTWLRKPFRFSLCWFGCHAWSMPGGWCEECGICDRFFGGHQECGKTCRHFEAEKGSTRP